MIKSCYYEKDSYIILFVVFLIFGCLEDEGNYDYYDIKEPKWHTDQPISVYATEHNVMKLRGHDAFRWDTDSVSRSGKYAMSGS